jgi:CBS domain-containing protein
MSKVSQILAKKGDTVWTVAPESNVYDALALMADKNVGALLVVQKEKIIGIFSERDYARKVVLKDKSSRDTSVSEIMTAEVVSVSPEDSIEACMSKMSDHRIRHLPVIDGQKLAGIISIGDVVNAVISEQQFTIEQLESYIKGT